MCYNTWGWKTSKVLSPVTSSTPALAFLLCNFFGDCQIFSLATCSLRPSPQQDNLKRIFLPFLCPLYSRPSSPSVMYKNKSRKFHELFSYSFYFAVTSVLWDLCSRNFIFCQTNLLPDYLENLRRKSVSRFVVWSAILKLSGLNTWLVLNYLFCCFLW